MLGFIAGVAWVLGSVAIAYYVARLYVQGARQAISEEVERMRADPKRQELEARLVSVESKVNLITAFRQKAPS